MIWNTTEVIAIFIENFMVSRLLILYFGYKEKKHQFLKSSLLFILLSLNGMIGTFIIKHELFLVLGFLFFGITFSNIFLKGHIFEKFLISIIGYVLFYFINLPVINLIGLLSDSNASELISIQNTSRIIAVFISKILYFAATQFILWIRKKEEYNFKTNEWIIIVSAFFITLMIGLMLYAITANSTLNDLAFMSIALLLSALDIIVFVSMRKMHFSNLKDTENQMLSMQLKQQQNEIQQLDQQYKNLSTLQHDFNNKIDCIHSLILQGEYDKAISYSGNLLGTNSNFLFNFIQSSSTVLNAVVNSKFGKAQKYEIRTSCRIVVSVPEDLEYDLSVLLSNLLDNAIEACQKNQIVSHIILSISEIAGYYSITVKNTIEQSVLKSNKQLKTQKENKYKHGWGLKSVKDIAELHNGSVDIYEENDMFIVNVLMAKK